MRKSEKREIVEEICLFVFFKIFELFVWSFSSKKSLFSVWL